MLLLVRMDTANRLNKWVFNGIRARHDQEYTIRPRRSVRPMLVPRVIVLLQCLIRAIYLFASNTTNTSSFVHSNSNWMAPRMGLFVLVCLYVLPNKQSIEILSGQRMMLNLALDAVPLWPASLNQTDKSFSWLLVTVRRVGNPSFDNVTVALLRNETQYMWLASLWSSWQSVEVSPCKNADKRCLDRSA